MRLTKNLQLIAVIFAILTSGYITYRAFDTAEPVYAFSGCHRAFGDTPDSSSVHQWEYNGYIYQVLKFGISAQGGLSTNPGVYGNEYMNLNFDGQPSTPNTNGVPCGGSSVVNIQNDERYKLLYNGQRTEMKPVSVEFGVPSHNPGMPGLGAGKWHPPINGVPPQPRPPIYASNYNRPAAQVDDSGRAVLKGANTGSWQTLWCAVLRDDPFVAYPDCGQGWNVKDISEFSPPAGAGHLFIQNNAPANGEGDGGGGTFDADGVADDGTDSFAWYQNYIGSNTDLTRFIGNESDGSLKNFELAFQARNTQSQGFGAQMWLTFKYPKPIYLNRTELAVTNIALSGVCTEVDAGQTIQFKVTAENTLDLEAPATWIEFKNPDPANINATTIPPSDGSDIYLTSRGYNDGVMASGDGAVPHYFWGRSKMPAYGEQYYKVDYQNVGYQIRSTAPGGSEFRFKSVITRHTPSTPKMYSNEICFRVKGGPPIKEKIYGANVIQPAASSNVRDNQNIDFRLMTYLWPDAGELKFAAHRTNRFWLAGAYGPDGEVFVGNPNPNTINVFNYNAENNCPGSISVCSQTVPLAYVPQDDGSGQANTATDDGSQTPNGNRWLSLRNEGFNLNYSERLGGIASTLNENVGGQTGNYINKVEISNIHVQALGITADTRNQSLQGRVGNGILETSDQATMNLPGGSQGPDANSPRWDNMRLPNGSADDAIFSDNINTPNIEFSNPSGSPRNFTYDPTAINSGIYNGFMQQYGTSTVTSFLQDGQDTDTSPQYQNPYEPLSYTARISGMTEARLVWDEYIDWTQVDDKGHYYTDRANRAIGVDAGSADSNDQATLTQLSSYNPGNPEYELEPHCDGPDLDTLPDDGCFWNELQNDFVCSSYGPTNVGYNTNSLSYWVGGYQTQYGWLNTSTTRQAMPYGGHGQTSQSAFYSSYSNQPGWSNTGTTAYWQDTGRTSMSNSGASSKPSHTQRWIYDTSDPAYSNRYIFNSQTTPFFYTGWYTYGSNSVCYWDNGGYSTSNYQVGVATHYPNPSYMYEYTSNPSTPHGQYNVTYDGNKDGVVDTGWSWSTNKQRVRYEQTFNGRFRKLGPRSAYGTPTLYGTVASEAIKAGRGTALIGNPIISISNADIYAGGPIDSYFRNSAAGSSFIFTNDYIRNFNTGPIYNNYFLNPNRNRVNSVYKDPSGALDPIRYVFQDYTSISSQAATIGSSISGTFNLGQQPGRIYKHSGDLTVGSTTFTGGAGTIIVEGDLIVTGNMGYGSAGSAREELPSVGFIIEGDIRVAANVTNLVGSYFASGFFDSGTGVSPVNRASSDPPLVLNGLVVANNFVLLRQTSGDFNVGGGAAEQFVYDGRIAINTPPGFSKLYSTPAVWNEGVPTN